ncbi:MAG: hypothetical protein K0Q51_1141 [Rickettsiaceae bacterium]|jgi:hypothetical protein|nr:hypothetical protein [Rickettsiaceae bacterium]
MQGKYEELSLNELFKMLEKTPSNNPVKADNIQYAILDRLGKFHLDEAKELIDKGLKETIQKAISDCHNKSQQEYKNTNYSQKQATDNKNIWYMIGSRLGHKLEAIEEWIEANSQSKASPKQSTIETKSAAKPAIKEEKEPQLRAINTPNNNQESFDQSYKRLLAEFEQIALDKPKLAREKFNEIRDLLKANPEKVVSYYGGDPFKVREDIYSLMDICKKRYPYYSNNKNIPIDRSIQKKWQSLRSDIDFYLYRNYFEGFRLEDIIVKAYERNPITIDDISKVYEDNASGYFKGKSNRFSNPEKFFNTNGSVQQSQETSMDKPSLEEVHEVNFNLKKAYSYFDDPLQGNRVASRLNFKSIESNLKKFTELDYQAKNGDGAKLGQDPEVKKLDALLKKDPQIVAREINKALKGAKGNGFEAGFNEENMAKALFENCTLEQSYKAALIGEELAKLKKNGGKASFTDNFKLFSKSIASIFSSKYKVNDKVLSEAAEAFKVLSDRQLQIDGSKTKNNSSKLKEAIGEFTKTLLASRKAKSKSKNSGQQSI